MSEESLKQESVEGAHAKSDDAAQASPNDTQCANGDQQSQRASSQPARSWAKRAYKPKASTPRERLGNAWQHLKTISQHKALVFDAARKAGIVGQGLTHDLSKFSPTEFMVGVDYFQGDRSPNAAERHDKGYSEAWMHHKGNNRHHYEYWTDMRDGGDGTLYGVPIPTRYVVEMMCDRIAAGKVYKKDDYTDDYPLEYFKAELSFGNLPMHPDSAAFLYMLLQLVAEMGEDEALAFVRENVVKPRFVYSENGFY